MSTVAAAAHPQGIWRVHEVVRALDEPDAILRDRAAEQLGLAGEDVVDLQIWRRSIDARGRRAPRFSHIVDVVLRDGVSPRTIAGNTAPTPAPTLRARRVADPSAVRPIVLGAGPCGLFAALQLAEAGLRPVILDRGKAVEPRAKDVARLMGQGIINPESNLCYGEGGAGTWSDGKLYTRVGGPRVREVLERLVDLGAPDRILVDGRPHLGTDRLVALLKTFRRTITELGGTVRYDARVDAVLSNDGVLTGVRLADGEVLDATHLILAPGHSARDLYRHLAETGVAMAPKGFAVGFRIEHPQALIDRIQYHDWADHAELPAAYYELSTQIATPAGDRGVYSFCMCPGGSVVPTPTHEGEICVNGMSHAARSGHWANSAMVVSVEPPDFAGWARSDAPIDRLLAGIPFQQAAEAKAWELGGGAFVAPAQRVEDYLAGRSSSDVRRTSYKRGVQAADLTACYPEAVTQSLHAALRRFEGRMRGYISQDAVLIGVETRTSAPVTILRDPQSLQSPSIAGVFPAGEGAGYGGGIVSAAIDGLRVADRLLDLVGAAVLQDPAG